jgi:hypothetical protein
MSMNLSLDFSPQRTAFLVGFASSKNGKGHRAANTVASKFGKQPAPKPAAHHCSKTMRAMAWSFRKIATQNGKSFPLTQLTSTATRQQI